MAFFALFMGMILCESESTSQTKGIMEDIPHRQMDDAAKHPGDTRLAEENRYYDARRKYKTSRVLYPEKTMKDKEKHKPKNSLLCGICMQDFFFLCLFLLSIILKIYSGKSSS